MVYRFRSREHTFPAVRILPAAGLSHGPLSCLRLAHTANQRRMVRSGMERTVADTSHNRHLMERQRASSFSSATVVAVPTTAGHRGPSAFLSLLALIARTPLPNAAPADA